MKIEACLSKKTDNWKTPSFIYDYFVNKCGFFDPCPYNENPEIDGLKIEWGGLNFVNPPYSKINKWVDKSIEEAKKNKVVIMLLPARTDTQWFKKIWNAGCAIMFIEGRLHFNDSASAPFPSMFVKVHLKETSCDYLTKEKMNEQLKLF